MDYQKFMIGVVVIVSFGLAVAATAAFASRDYRLAVFPEGTGVEAVWQRRYLSFMDCRMARGEIINLLNMTNAEYGSVTCGPEEA